jgi:ABC-type bacteriocin/lantibiotic exporter with double-glycine peptidase domain
MASHVIHMQVVEGKMTAGELSSFVIYALYVGGNVGALAGVISSLIQVLPQIGIL